MREFFDYQEAFEEPRLRLALKVMIKKFVYIYKTLVL
jgi:hypothetical protein